MSEEHGSRSQLIPKTRCSGVSQVAISPDELQTLESVDMGGLNLEETFQRLMSKTNTDGKL
jgi:hypothetical protein